MGSAALKLMEPDAFLAACQTRYERWELVAGRLAMSEIYDGTDLQEDPEIEV